MLAKSIMGRREYFILFVSISNGDNIEPASVYKIVHIQELVYSHLYLFWIYENCYEKDTIQFASNPFSPLAYAYHISFNQANERCHRRKLSYVYVFSLLLAWTGEAWNLHHEYEIPTGNKWRIEGFILALLVKNMQTVVQPDTLRFWPDLCSLTWHALPCSCYFTHLDLWIVLLYCVCISVQALGYLLFLLVLTSLASVLTLWGVDLWWQLGIYSQKEKTRTHVRDWSRTPECICSESKGLIQVENTR
jgi:hypothetical protein